MFSYRSVAAAILITLAFCGCQKKETDSIREVQIFHRPKNATNCVEGSKLPYCLCYDPSKWMIWQTACPTEEGAEWNLILTDTKDREMIGKNMVIRAETRAYPYKDKSLGRKDFKELIQSRIVKKGNIVEFVDLGSEDRIVNNLKVFAWNFRFKYTDAQETTAYIYFYSDNQGSVALVSFTPSDEWEANKADMIELLNGFCILQGDNSTD